jgi:hypothetical protein
MSGLSIKFDKNMCHVLYKSYGGKFYRGYLTVNGMPYQTKRAFRTASYAKFYARRLMNRYYTLKIAEEKLNENSN